MTSPRVNPQGLLAAAYLTWVDDTTGLPNQLVFDLVSEEKWAEPSKATEHPVEVGSDISDNLRVGLVTVTLKVFATNEPIVDSQWSDVSTTTELLSVPTPFWVENDGIRDTKQWKSFIFERSLLGTGTGLIAGLAGSTANAIGAVGGSLLASALLPGIVVDEVEFTDQGLPPPSPRDSVAVQTLQPDTGDDFVARTIQQLIDLKEARQLVTVIGTKRTLQNMAIETFDHERDFASGTGASITLGLKEVRFVSTVNVPAPAPTVPRAQPKVSKGPVNPTDDKPRDSVSFDMVGGKL